MKSISVVCAVALTVTCICILQTTAVPFSQSEITEHQIRAPKKKSTYKYKVTNSFALFVQVLFRTKRQSHLSLCRYCCNCCKNKGCGFCCRF
uniref:Hepcidin n=1 Tax=Astyanax mexicanus TaxID=7994 RepID=A0A8B9H3S3_ASTMX